EGREREGRRAKEEGRRKPETRNQKPEDSCEEPRFFLVSGFPPPARRSPPPSRPASHLLRSADKEKNHTRVRLTCATKRPHDDPGRRHGGAVVSAHARPGQARGAVRRAIPDH